MSEENMKVRIIFKSGADLCLNVKSFKVNYSTMSGELTKLEWVLAEGAGNLMHISLSDVACIMQLP